MVPPSSSVDPAAGDVATLDDIMHRYSTGDGALFRALYEALAPRIFRFCLRLSRRRNEAEDLLQDTFLRLHRARATYDPGAPVVPWAFAIARSAYLDQARRRRRRPEGALSETGAPAEQLNLKCDAPADSAANVRALQQVIGRELERLSEKNRSAYVLLIEEGLSVAEAAAVLGVSNDAVKQRAHRAYDQIRAAVRRAGWDGDL